MGNITTIGSDSILCPIDKTTMKGLFRLEFVSITIFFLLASCDRNNVNNRCNNLLFFCSIEINGEVVCYENCFARLSTTSTKTLIHITAGNTTDSEGGIILNPAFIFTIPGIATGTWNNDSIKGLDFIAFSNYNEGNYVFPAYEQPSLLTLISDFNITISLCDTINKKIEGFFNGTLVDNASIDSIIVNNGKFTAFIME